MLAMRGVLSMRVCDCASLGSMPLCVACVMVWKSDCVTRGLPGNGDDDDNNACVCVCRCAIRASRFASSAICRSYTHTRVHIPHFAILDSRFRRTHTHCADDAHPDYYCYGQKLMFHYSNRTLIAYTCDCIYITDMYVDDVDNMTHSKKRSRWVDLLRTPRAQSLRSKRPDIWARSLLAASVQLETRGTHTCDYFTRLCAHIIRNHLWCHRIIKQPPHDNLLCIIRQRSAR